MSTYRRQFPRLAAALPRALAAIAEYERAWASPSAVIMDKVRSAAAKTNPVLELAVREFCAEQPLNRFETLRSAFGPKADWQVWGGFNDAPPIGGHQAGFFFEAARVPWSEDLIPTRPAPTEATHAS